MASVNVINPIALILLGTVLTASAENVWYDATATFYGDMDGGEARYGACGYDTFSQGYGLETAALSAALFNDGATCGACYHLVCAHSQWCKDVDRPIKITATNFCPSTTGQYPWCNPPRKHFDLTMKMFLQIGVYEAGIIPVKYRRTNCNRHGGLKFQIANENPYWLLVLVYNVARDGIVTDMKVKGANTNWTQMTRNWGQNWQVSGDQWQGQSLSFQVTTSDGKSLTINDVIPSNRQKGQSFEAPGLANF